jgi:hypothetical protein
VTPEDLSRIVAAAIQRHEGVPPATRQLRAAGEELEVLVPLSAAIGACKTPEVQVRLCDEIKDALLRAIAHVEEAKTLIEADAAAAFAPRPKPDGEPGL